MRRSGFKTIVFLGDSGDNQQGMRRAAEELTREWSLEAGALSAKVVFVPEYYNYRDIERWLTEKGFSQKPEGIHDDLAFTAELAALDEELVRYPERKDAGKLSINGISIADKSALVALGNEIMSMRAKNTAEAIRRRRKE